MRKEVVVEGNLDLFDEFMRCVFAHPELLDQIPPEAELVFLPLDDAELSEHNKRMAEQIISEGRKVVLVKLKKPQPPVAELEIVSEAGV